MNQFINGARYVYKDDTANVQTFTSGEHGYLEYIADDRVIRYEQGSC